LNGSAFPILVSAFYCNDYSSITESLNSSLNNAISLLVILYYLEAAIISEASFSTVGIVSKQFIISSNEL